MGVKKTYIALCYSGIEIILDKIGAMFQVHSIKHLLNRTMFCANNFHQTNNLLIIGRELVRYLFGTCSVIASSLKQKRKAEKVVVESWIFSCRTSSVV